MLKIQTILDSCKTISKQTPLAVAHSQLLPLAHEYCKQHDNSPEIILIISIKPHKPFVFSYSYDFAIADLHTQVKNSLALARKALDADIIVLEWFTLKKVKLPYYVHFV